PYPRLRRRYLPPLRGGLILGSTSGRGDRAFQSLAPPPALGAVPSPTCGWAGFLPHGTAVEWGSTAEGREGARAQRAGRGRERSEPGGARAQRAEGGASAAS